MPLITMGDTRFIFCHIPRTAGRSFLQALVHSGCEVDYRTPRGNHPHPTMHEMRKVHGRGIPSVAVVREPIARFISAMRFEDRAESTEHLVKVIRKMRQPPHDETRHFFPQCEFIDEDTRIFSFENGLSELEKEMKTFGIIKPTVQLNRVNGGSNHVQLETTARGLTKVRRWYKHDVKRLGY